MVTQIYLIPFLPFVAFVINLFFGKKLGEKSAYVSSVLSAVSFALAVPVMIQSAGGAHLHHEFAFLTLGSYQLEFGYLIDPLSTVLLFVVTFVGTLIQIYAKGYMHGDPKFSRFFAYVSLFMAAMLTLVISNNYLMFFMAWEVMGLCSYLLIGFWFEKDSAANASRKAFLTTRVGDVGFFLGILTLFVATGSLSFSDLHHVGDHPHALIPVAALLIFCGTIGKSAQFPLHVWLPDAMEGPTPVSSLIHAATMVAAGVFLVARSFPLFEAAPDAMTVVAYIGTFTALMAAFIALTATDIKKVLAYSTISQLGFMVAALGLGSLTAGMFHLMTHAFFKALLFMGAGSVIHGTGTQEIKELGGVFSKMKHTAWTFVIGAIAIAGVPPFAGFWSKDEILLAAYKSDLPFIYIVLLVSACMTAFYMFRLVFLTFYGKPRNESIHPHESPASMTVPLWILAVGSMVLGLPGSPFMNYWLVNFMHHGGHHAEHVINWTVMGSSIISASLGILLAALMYLWKPSLSETAGKIFKPLYTASINKLWFDEIYKVLIVEPFHAIGRLLFKFDAAVIDGTVNFIGFLTIVKSRVHHWIDAHIVDGLVNFVGYVTKLSSALSRKIQTGLVQNYLLFVFLGVIGLIYFELKS